MQAGGGEILVDPNDETADFLSPTVAFRFSRRPTVNWASIYLLAAPKPCSNEL